MDDWFPKETRFWATPTFEMFRHGRNRSRNKPSLVYADMRVLAYQEVY